MATKKKTKSASAKGKKSQTLKDLASDYAGYLRTKHSIRFLTQIYEKAYQWKPKLSIIAPGRRPDEALKLLRKRLQELRSLKKRYEKSGLLKKIHRMHCKKGKPFSPYSNASKNAPTARSLKKGGATGLEKDIVSVIPYTEPDENIGLPETLRDILDRLGPPYQEETFLVGKVLSSGFEECEWSPKSVGGSEGEIKFEPSISSNSFLNTAKMKFSCNLEAPSGCITDPVEFMAKSAIFQFTLPEAPWDAAVEWDVFAFYNIQGLDINADYGWLSIETWARQDPTGGNFPTCSNNYSNAFSYDITTSIGDENILLEDWISNDAHYWGAFPIRKGKQARLYIGCSIGLWAENGSIDLSYGGASFCASYNESNLGVNYSMNKLA